MQMDIKIRQIQETSVDVCTKNRIFVPIQSKHPHIRCYINKV